MLPEIVRPLVRTQVRLLASATSTRQTLVQTIARWLGYLGVEAQVTQLETDANQIQVALRVGKPSTCDPRDWQKIIDNLSQGDSSQPLVDLTYEQMSEKQQTKLQRLLAYMVQVAQPEAEVDWDKFVPLLKNLEFNDQLIAGIRVALKVPQSLDLLTEELEPDIAAIALEKAVSIALLDRRVNPQEDQALTKFLDAMKVSEA
ncbi:MAG: hypothetical protein HC835_17230 [Oscillatoriales cyanobacterium RM2_1_1]|nr:hypothetical protein [Oscillatoriales cyanobacterium SM2_3_0]NJO47211.1 hypothetical protein [Oscillatoriales cyanobacterium RM2_1_1]